MKKLFYPLFLVGLSLSVYHCKSGGTQWVYIDSVLPDTKPALFAPSIVNTDSIEINAVYNAAYTELFFTRIIHGRFVIHHSELKDGEWTIPQAIEMYADRESESVAIDPSINQAGDVLYFLGISPEERAQRAKPNIYKSQKIGGKWQLATKVGYPISTDEYAESYPVVVADGSLYFTSDRPDSYGKRDIYRAQYLGNGQFDTPKNIGPEVNTEKGERSTYVSPDERFLITANTYSDEKGFAVSFKENGQWQTPRHFSIGEKALEDWIYFCPYMSPDQQYFFYSRRYSDPPGSGWKGVNRGEVYWVRADAIFNADKE